MDIKRMTADDLVGIGERNSEVRAAFHFPVFVTSNGIGGEKCSYFLLRPRFYDNYDGATDTVGELLLRWIVITKKR
jgi:hypothetical protein